MKTVTRREFLGYSGIGGAALLSCTWPLSRPLLAADRKVTEITLSAAVTSTDLGQGSPFKAWTYNGLLPGPEIRVSEGDLLRVTLHNNLPEATTIHWHGLPVPNAMDGVPGITQKPVQPGETFTYAFTARPAGTYLYHSHAAYQLDRGLYGTLIVEPPGKNCPMTGNTRLYWKTGPEWTAAAPRHPGRGGPARAGWV